ncbi:MAG: hypothetical protein RLZZ450_5706 [Pseudomonadota bacterium]|jgi:hypothetical protein
MALKLWSVVVASLVLVFGCEESSPSDPEKTDETTTDAGATKPDSGKTVKNDAGVTAEPEDDASDEDENDQGTTPVSAKPDAGTVKPTGKDGGSVDSGAPVDGTPVKYDYVKQEVKLTADLVIPAGKTVRVGPEVNFTASGDFKVQVLGELIVDGTDGVSSFLGAGKPRSWHGIVVEKGGKLTLNHAKIDGAAYGIFAMPGSEYKVDYTTISNSFKCAVVQSNGSFAHSKFVASAPPTISLADDVTVDDPNGALTIMDASPTVTDSNFDGASAFADMIRVGGKSSPTFDHIYVHAAHCGFHTSGGTNTSARITNSIFEGLSYGIMAYATKPIVENSVFKGNLTDIGICSGATEDNAAVLKSNNYSNGEVALDASCFKIKIVDPSPASAPNPTAGPSGL